MQRNLSIVIAAAFVGAIAACGSSTEGADDSATVAITPHAPTTADDLVATATGDGADRVEWYRNGVVLTDVTTMTVPNALTTRGDVWEVWLVDAADVTVAIDQVTIGDAAPTAPVIAVTMAPLPSDSIQCTITTPSTDIDGDAIAYSATWTRNGVAFTGATTVFTGDTIPINVSSEGDMFVCTVTASDGTVETASTTATAAPTCLAASTPPPATFMFSGATASFTVAACTSQVHVKVCGAQGGGPNGGLGGCASGVLTVTGHEVLTVVVGGKNGFNGGGMGQAATNAPNGGGASDLRISTLSFDPRLVVGGGGGGGGNGDAPGNFLGGSGGGGTCGANYCGGGGGVGYAGNGGAGAVSGGTGVNATYAGGGGGGGLISGGAASCESYDLPATCGTAGTLGQGGNGGNAMAHAICYTTDFGTAGGGGGYFGGGGTAVGFCGGGAGGGGSSWTGALTSVSMSAGTQAGDGLVVITPL